LHNAKMPFFSICIPTHNRIDTLDLSIQTVLNQTFQDFEIIISDNASEGNVKSFVAKYKDTRIRYYHHKVLLDANDNWEFALQQAQGDFVVLLADDDGLVLGALERIYQFVQNTKAKIVQVAHIRYVHPKSSVGNKVDNNLQKIIPNSVIDSEFTGEIQKLNSAQFTSRIFNGWGIGKANVAPKWFPSCHPSGLFMARDLIKRASDNNGRITAKPFADVGFLNAILLTKELFYIDSPLAIVGVDVGREVNGPLKGRRRYYGRLNTSILFSPFKATTFNNMAVEAHLKVLNLNKNIFSPKDFVLEDTFFIKHISEIIQDDIWDKKTLDDLYEAIRVVSKLKIKKQLFIYLRLVKHIIVKPIVEIFSRHNNVSNGSGDTYSFVLGDEHGFANLAECSKFIESEYVSK